MDTAMERGGKRPATAAEVRAWGREHGFTTGNRGHLPEALVKAYNHRHHKRVFESSNPWTAKKAA